jgi:hypothetical protein
MTLRLPSAMSGQLLKNRQQARNRKKMIVRGDKPLGDRHVKLKK